MNYLYPTAKIYKIVCLTTDNFYIGSTTKDLNERLNGHIDNYNLYLENKYRYVSSFEILKNKNYNIFLIENFPCNDIKDLKYREGRYQKYLSYFGCINKHIAGRTKKEYQKEYYKDKRNKIKEQHKEYYRDNKEKIKEKKKEYRENNKEKIKEKTKEYRENNKDKIKEIAKKYRENNKEKIKEITICECGAKITKGNISAHKKTKKHLTLLNK